MGHTDMDVARPLRVRALTRRAYRHARKGRIRKAVVALRERVALCGDGPSWVRLAGMLLRAGSQDCALHALNQALFSYRRSGATGRARTVSNMILQLNPGDRQASRYRDSSRAA